VGKFAIKTLHETLLNKCLQSVLMKETFLRDWT